MTVATKPESPQFKSTATGRMKALVYHGPGKRAWEETPRPAIQNATDSNVYACALAAFDDLNDCSLSSIGRVRMEGRRIRAAGPTNRVYPAVLSDCHLIPTGWYAENPINTSVVSSEKKLLGPHTLICIDGD
jgi:hypothetical protein